MPCLLWVELPPSARVVTSEGRNTGWMDRHIKGKSIFSTIKWPVSPMTQTEGAANLCMEICDDIY